MIESMQASPVARVIISISAMLFAGFAMTRITKRLRLPNVTGYILAGILMGPCCLNVIPQTIIDGTDFLSDVALAFIAFSAGEFFKIDVLKRNGAKVIVITVLEACLASVAVFALVYGVLHLELSFSIVLAALASATAPASTMMTIRQTGAHGDFVDTLLQVVALDDVVGLILYSVAISVAMASESGHMQLATVMKPILANICVLAMGARTLGGEMGETLQTIILASSVLYELVGPGCSKLALYLSGSYGRNAPEPIGEEQNASKSGLETLIERMKAIEAHLPDPVETSAEEELAFTQAALEQYDLAQYYHNRRFKGGRSTGGIHP